MNNHIANNNGEVIKAIEYKSKILSNLDYKTSSELTNILIKKPIINKTLNDIIKNYYYGLFYDGFVYLIYYEELKTFYIARNFEVEIKDNVIKFGNRISKNFQMITNEDPVTGKIRPQYQEIENEIYEKYASQKNNVQLLENGLLIREVFATEKPIPENQRESFLDRLKNEYSLTMNRMTNKFGVKKKENNKKTSLVLSGNKMDYTSVSANLADVQNTTLANKNRDFIYNYLGVPPQLMGSSETSTYSNYKEAQRAFYQNTIIPEASIIANLLSLVLKINVTVNYEDAIAFLDEKERNFNMLKILHDEEVITDEQLLRESGFAHLADEKGGD